MLLPQHLHNAYEPDDIGAKIKFSKIPTLEFIQQLIEHQNWNFILDCIIIQCLKIYTE